MSPKSKEYLIRGLPVTKARARFEVHGNVITLCMPGKSARVFYFEPLYDGCDFGRAMEDISTEEKIVVGPGLGGCKHLKKGVYLVIQRNGLLKFLRSEYRKLRLWTKDQCRYYSERK